MRITVDEAVFDTKSRIAMIALMRLSLSCLDRWRSDETIKGGKALDIEFGLILTAITVIGTQPLTFNADDQKYFSLANAVPIERLRKCNISSIASSTGINRETVRRRVKSLENSGLIENHPKVGLCFVKESGRDAISQAAFIGPLREIANTMSMLVSHGIFTLALTDPDLEHLPKGHHRGNVTEI